MYATKLCMALKRKQMCFCVLENDFAIILKGRNSYFSSDIYHLQISSKLQHYTIAIHKLTLTPIFININTNNKTRHTHQICWCRHNRPPFFATCLSVYTFALILLQKCPRNKFPGWNKPASNCGGWPLTKPYKFQFYLAKCTLKMNFLTCPPSLLHVFKLNQSEGVKIAEPIRGQENGHVTRPVWSLFFSVNLKPD